MAEVTYLVHFKTMEQSTGAAQDVLVLKLEENYAKMQV